MQDKAYELPIEIIISENIFFKNKKQKKERPEEQLIAAHKLSCSAIRIGMKDHVFKVFFVGKFGQYELLVIFRGMEEGGEVNKTINTNKQQKNIFSYTRAC